MSVRNPVVLENAKLQFSSIEVGAKDFVVECKGFVLSRRVVSYPPYTVNVFGKPLEEGLWFILGNPSEVRLTFSDLTDVKVWPSLPDYSFDIVCQADRDGLLQVNEKATSISFGAGDNLTIPVILGCTYGFEATIVLEKLRVYVGTLAPDPSKLVFDLQWDGIGLPWNAVNGERGELISGSIRPLYPVTRVEGQRGPGYKIQPGSKISFPDIPAGTLQIAKREDGIITTVESDFTGGTLELTEPDLLDAKVVDSSGSELFALGKKVGDTVFDVINPTQTGEISGNVEVVEREVAWALEFDGTRYVDCGNGEALNITSVLSLLAQVSSSYNDPTVYNYIVGKESLYSSGYGLVLYSKYDFYTRNGGLYENLAVFPDLGVPATLVGVLQSDQTSHLYINGRLENSLAAAFPGDTADYPLRIGYSGRPQGADRHFYGLIHLPLILAPTAWSQSIVSRLTQRDFSCIRPEDTVLWLDYDPSRGQLIDRSPYNHQIQVVGGVQIKRVMI